MAASPTQPRLKGNKKPLIFIPIPNMQHSAGLSTGLFRKALRHGRLLAPENQVMIPILENAFLVSGSSRQQRTNAVGARRAVLGDRFTQSSWNGSCHFGFLILTPTKDHVNYLSGKLFVGVFFPAQHDPDSLSLSAHFSAKLKILL